MGQIRATVAAGDATADSCLRIQISNLLQSPPMEEEATFDASSSVLSTLSSSDILLLLSPAIPGPDPALDPFEPFGRALSRFHPKVRHVPYVPAHGMRDIHREFLAEAGAVVVVVAIGMVPAAVAERQKRFAAMVTAELGSEVPSLLVVVRAPQCADEPVPGKGYDAMICGSSCRPEHLRDLAFQAFGQEELAKHE